MACRRSRRLAGLRPECELYHDYCFVCLLPLDLGSLSKCVRKDCCGKFLHKRCFAKTPDQRVCGHCREERDLREEPDLRSDQYTNELAQQALVRIRDHRLLHSYRGFHAPGTHSYMMVSFF